MENIVIAVGLALGLASILVVQYACAAGFVSLHKRPWQDSPDGDLPEALVILALRGADPYLERTVESLLELDYPRYDLRFVVDCRDDPAWSVVQTVLDRSDAVNVALKVLDKPSSTCGLRVSALLQEIVGLDERYGAVVWLDADVIPYRRWLRDMLEPFGNPKVGATSGIRWYLPNSGGWGTVLRALWNVGSVIYMQAFGIGFGGSMAVRSEILRDTTVLDKWRCILWEDTYMFQVMSDAGLRLQFVPRATMANQETIGLLACFRFVRRQILNARLYHPSWWALLSLGTMSCVLPLLGLSVALIETLRGNALLATIDMSLVMGYILGSTVIYGWAGACSNRVVRQRGIPNWRFPVSVVWIAPLVPVFHLVASVSAAVTRKIEWRGIEYCVRGPAEIEMTQYVPYRMRDGAGAVDSSLM
ncbi:MAG: glycosyltransferase family 2 protein [Planctomycetaceae bacterium]